MAVLVWDKVGEKIYEAGVSNCVLYKTGVPGVVWNGLTAIDEEGVNSVEAVHFDGVKFNDLVTVGDFAGSIKAFTFPDEFLECEGVVEDVEGFYLTSQMPMPFSLSYKTQIGNDIRGLTAGYKIHILYNLTAIPSTRSNETLSLDVEPIEFEWSITSIPEHLEYYHPTAHIILDSRKMDRHLFSDLEDILYGTETTDPHLPPLNSLTTFIQYWGRFVVTDLGNGLWTAFSPLEGVITRPDGISFEINVDTAVFIDEHTYEISSSDTIEV